MDDPWRELETLRMFLRKARDNFFSSPYHEHLFKDMTDRAEWLLHSIDRVRSESITNQALQELRRFLGDRPWTALIVPSGQDYQLDQWISEPEFLRFLVHIRPDDPGLILQLEEPPQRIFALTDVFPAFRTALADANNWPGILIWTPRGDSAFLPFGTRERHVIQERAHWIFSHLSTALGVDLGLLRQQYQREFSHAFVRSGKTLHIIQLSDLHIGSKEANRRMPRIQQVVRNLVEELAPSGDILPTITGDLVDSPNDRNFDAARAFLDFLSDIGSDDPVILLGNHDVRKDGILLESFKRAIRFPVAPRVRWASRYNVALICMNSVEGGSLARGRVGETQLIDLGNEIDRRKDSNEYSRVALLHHHPTPVDVPDWYVRPFYERILGGSFEKTDELEDAEGVMSFLRCRRVSAVLHGHKHIPRASISGEGPAVFGCGSSVGKVSTKDGGTYMSINIVSIEGSSGLVTGRLLAERVPGGGMTEEKRHEVVLRSGPRERTT
jgi:3',5'-cyclic AMP phosphodiesterase CpdA